MIKIYNPNASSNQIGGGWTFRRNLEKALAGQIQFVPTWQECDVMFISGVTMVDEGEVKAVHAAGKKLVLRVDNMPRKSRNRMTPHERMAEYAALADAVVYQSKWAQRWVGSYLGVEGVVILNGVDTDVFKPAPHEERQFKKFLIVQYNRDENKRMPEAFDMYSEHWMEHKDSVLTVVGAFSPELVKANFDLFRGETVRYLGVMERPEQMAEVMRCHDVLLYPSYSDACPNTVIEARACGMEVWHRGHAGVGEAASIADPSLKRMGAEYLQLFNTILEAK